jgi:hypothetical protein
MTSATDRRRRVDAMLVLDTRETARVPGVRGGGPERHLHFRAPSAYIEMRLPEAPAAAVDTDPDQAWIRGQFVGPEVGIGAMETLRVTLRCEGRPERTVMGERTGDFFIAAPPPGPVELEFDSSCGPRIRVRFSV